MRVTFLGTSGSMPTPERGSSSVVIRKDKELFMFDCGEGTQRQMVKAGIAFQRKMRIFISVLYSVYAKSGAMIEVASLLEDWDAGIPKGITRSYSEEIIEKYRRALKL